MRRAPVQVAFAFLLWASACYSPHQVNQLSVGDIAPSSSDLPGATDTEGLLTADEAVRRGLAHHPAVRVARLRVEVARAGVDAIVPMENPELRLSQWHLEDAADGTWAKMDLSLRFRPERPGMHTSRLDAGQQRVLEATARLRAVESDLVHRVRRLHARAILYRERTDNAEREAGLRRDASTLMETRLTAGEATELDLQLARADLAEVEDEAGEFRAEALETAALLKATIGVEGTGWEIGGLPGGVDDGVQHAQGSSSLLEEEAVRNRPELREATARISRAHARAWQERARRWPWLRYAQVGYEFDEDSSPKSWVMSAGLELPVFHWNSGRVHEAEARVQHAEEVRRRDAAEIVEQVRALHARVVQGTRRLTRVREVLLPAAEAAAKEAERASAQGALKGWRTLSVAASRLEAHSRYLDARWDLARAVIDLDAALGRPFPTEVIVTGGKGDSLPVNAP